MKQLRETFTDEEHKQLKAAKDSTGLTWHDFIMRSKDVVGVVAVGIVKVKAVCPKCGERLLVNLDDLNRGEE